MDRYVRVEQPREAQPSIEDNEIRVMSSGKLHSYVAYATTLFTVSMLMPDDREYTLFAQERGHTSILLKGMGRAINKTVTVGTPTPTYNKGDHHPYIIAHSRGAQAPCSRVASAHGDRIRRPCGHVGANGRRPEPHGNRAPCAGYFHPPVHAPAPHRRPRLPGPPHR